MLHHNIIFRRSPLFALDSLLENLCDADCLHSRALRGSDIEETETAYRISLDLPGIPKEQVQISLENGYLAIEAQPPKGQERRKLQRSQLYGRKVFQLVKGLDEESITAQLADGVLSVELAKKPKHNKRLIAIE